MKILITRPEPEASVLAHSLRAEGHEVVVLPLLQIQLLAKSEVPVLGEKLIFVSKNAVCGFQYWALCQGKTLFAMGPGTAGLLRERGLEVVYPQTAGGTEALLSMPDLQDLRGQKWTVIAGRPGRPDLQLALQARGAEVHCHEVYVTRRIPLDAGQRQQLQDQYDLVIITSLDALRYACESGLRSDLKISILSQNMLKYAESHGFQQFLKLDLGDQAEICIKIKESQ